MGDPVLARVQGVATRDGIPHAPDKEAQVSREVGCRKRPEHGGQRLES